MEKFPLISYLEHRCYVYNIYNIIYDFEAILINVFNVILMRSDKTDYICFEMIITDPTISQGYHLKKYKIINSIYLRKYKFLTHYSYQVTSLRDIIVNLPKSGKLTKSDCLKNAEIETVTA